MTATGVPIIVHSHLRWDFVWQRPQQILSRLAAHHPVLFIEEPVHASGAPSLDLSEPHPNVFRAVPKLRATEVDAQCAQVAPLVERALGAAPLAGRFHRPIQWFYSPMTAPRMLGRFGAVGIVYDCMDELANFRFAPPDIAARERHLLERAHIVFTGGHALYEAKSRQHPATHVFGCGVDVEHYGKARLVQTRVPPEVTDLPQPIFGYFGVIDERLDYALLDTLATRCPEGSLVMVGPVAKVDPAELPNRPNIHWLGQRPYEALPALVKSFDVCLMPFALNEATRYINPTKTLEYMAAGKPIVSTAVPDVLHHFTPIVEVAETHEAFVAAARRAASAPRTDMIARGIDRARSATWEATVASMRQLMLDAVFGRAAGVPAKTRRTAAAA
jgi:glycosyltransferase involved in cell wall biosynthesis